ncbi:MAG: hypothetical protein NVSMB68_01480 [Thermoanaerobaculia bacterium]
MTDLNKVQQAVQGVSVPGVRGLTARQNGNLIEIHGQADNIGAKQSAMRAITEKVGDAGLQNNIEVTTAQQPKAAGGSVSGPGAQSSQAGGGRTHTVGQGETLTGIAQKYYGKASEFQKIVDANRDKISDANKIREGMTIRIP